MKKELIALKFETEEVMWAGTNEGCLPLGHPYKVDAELRNNWARLRFDQVVTEASANYYSALNLRWIMDNQLQVNNSVSEGQLTVFIERQPLADLLAGTAVTYGTNVVTATGIETTAANSLVNAINLLAVAHGWLISTLNTVPNGGKQLAANIDF